MAHKRHAAEQPSGSKKPRYRSPSDHDRRFDDGAGHDKKVWGPVPQYLGAQSAYPPMRNMIKMTDLYMEIPAGRRPEVEPWVQYGESVNHPSRRPQRSAEEHLVRAACSVDPNMRARVAAQGIESAWDDEPVFNTSLHRQYRQGLREREQQYQQSQQYQPHQQSQSYQPRRQQPQAYEQHRQQQYQQYTQAAQAAHAAHAAMRSAKARGKEPDRGYR